MITLLIRSSHSLQFRDRTRLNQHGKPLNEPVAGLDGGEMGVDQTSHELFIALFCETIKH